MSTAAPAQRCALGSPDESPSQGAGADLSGHLTQLAWGESEGIPVSSS